MIGEEYEYKDQVKDKVMDISDTSSHQSPVPAGDSCCLLRPC